MVISAQATSRTSTDTASTVSIRATSWSSSRHAVLEVTAAPAPDPRPSTTRSPPVLGPGDVDRGASRRPVHLLDETVDPLHPSGRHPPARRRAPAVGCTTVPSTTAWAINGWHRDVVRRPGTLRRPRVERASHRPRRARDHADHAPTSAGLEPPARSPTMRVGQRGVVECTPPRSSRVSAVPEGDHGRGRSVSSSTSTGSRAGRRGRGSWPGVDGEHDERVARVEAEHDRDERPGGRPDRGR